jgi:sugar (pentulose or hexulose) kinase
VETSEPSGLGTTVFNAFGTWNLNSIEEEVQEMVQYKNEFNPNKSNVAIYNQLYKKVYKKMYKML